MLDGECSDSIFGKGQVGDDESTDDEEQLNAQV